MKRKILAVAVLAVLALCVCAFGQISGTVRVWPQIVHTKSNGVAVAVETVGQIVEQAVAYGTNANQMTKWASRTGTLTNGEAATFTLLALTNAFGDALAFSRVNWLAVVAPTSNLAAIEVGNAAADPFVGWIGGTTPTASVLPGGCLVAFAPSATGYAVATNNHALRIANGSTNAASYYLYVGGN